MEKSRVVEEKGRVGRKRLLTAPCVCVCVCVRHQHTGIQVFLLRHYSTSLAALHSRLVKYG